MSAEDDARMFEAILCALIVRAGGDITLSAEEIRAASADYHLCPRADWREQRVSLSVRATRPEPHAVAFHRPSVAE
jgi:hypothetical protein